MKITCICGELLSDNTDFISYKAHVVADQDYFDYLDAAPGRERHQYERAMYQCNDCGRLLLQNRAGDMHHYTFFMPEDATAAKSALRSNLGARWRGFLRGDWGRSREVWWFAGDGEGGAEQFETWEALERRYRQLFETLRARDLLRHAFLTKDAETVHAWPPQDE